MDPKYTRNPSGVRQVYPRPGCFLKGWDIYNGTGSAVFVQVFQLPSAEVVLGTTAPNWVIPVNTMASRDLSEEGIEMRAFSYAVTTEDDNAVEPSPGDVTDTIDVTFYCK